MDLMGKTFANHSKSNWMTLKSFIKVLTWSKQYGCYAENTFEEGKTENMETSQKAVGAI